MKKLTDKIAVSELTAQGQYLRTEILVWCIGCDQLHSLTIDRAPGRSGPLWQWNRNEEAPTFSPSLMVNRPGNRCHSFIRNGQWQYLSDCNHPYAGKTVDMIPLPSWVFD